MRTISVPETSVEVMKILESRPAFVTSGVADWLSRLVDLNPGLAPPRTDPTAEDPDAADWLRRFVREVVTVNPVTRDALSSIQIFLIEYALDCVDWEALARDPRFCHLDWSQARLTAP
jgi:hypothetical protein